MKHQNDSIKIGISSCLLGNHVRWDAGHCGDPFIIETFGRYVEYVPVCPEIECGFGVPRETLRLEGDWRNPRLVTTNTKIDHTERMKTWACKRLKELMHEKLCGFIFKSGSPSSGMRHVKVFPGGNVAPVRKGIGIFAKAFMDYFSTIPIEDDQRLYHPNIRENFIQQIFTMKQWREFLSRKKSIGSLVQFHTRQKLLALSHSPAHYRLMGKLVAQGKSYSLVQFYDAYENLLIQALRLKATVKKHVNVLHHIMGYFKKDLSTNEKVELLEMIDTYYQEKIPLIVPITLLNHYVKKYDQPYLTEQSYLNPHPVDLKLRYHV